MVKKKITTLNIDEKLLSMAKKEIPNISGFIEECLRVYMGLNDKTHTIQEELDIIKQAQLNIHILTSQEYENMEIKQLNDEKLNEAWLRVWAVYRNNETMYEPEIIKSARILGIKQNILIDMMQTLMAYLSREDLIKCDNYNYSMQKYNEIK